MACDELKQQNSQERKNINKSLLLLLRASRRGLVSVDRMSSLILNRKRCDILISFVFYLIFFSSAVVRVRDLMTWQLLTCWIFIEFANLCSVFSGAVSWTQFCVYDEAIPNVIKDNHQRSLLMTQLCSYLCFDVSSLVEGSRQNIFDSLITAA